MKDTEEKLLRGLFETKAIRVCPADSPFWYTSGKIGPYYINTHFLYGSEEKANALLRLIDTVKEDKEKCSGIVSGYVLNNYSEDRIYRDTIDVLAETITETVPEGSYDYISGGERRDWFFSLAIAYLFHKPHITIFKDLDTFVYENGKSVRLDALNGAKVLHIADLITSASSYERAWIPAIQNAAGLIKTSFVIVDRLQGGSELLESFGVASNALVKIDGDTFRKAKERKYIDSKQYQMNLRYIEDPDHFMESFFRRHPEFIRKALLSDEKTAQRARLCIENGYCRGTD